MLSSPIPPFPFLAFSSHHFHSLPFLSRHFHSLASYSAPVCPHPHSYPIPIPNLTPNYPPCPTSWSFQPAGTCGDQSTDGIFVGVYFEWRCFIRQHRRPHQVHSLPTLLLCRYLAMQRRHAMEEPMFYHNWHVHARLSHAISSTSACTPSPSYPRSPIGMAYMLLNMVSGVLERLLQRKVWKRWFGMRWRSSALCFLGGSLGVLGRSVHSAH